MIVFCGVDPKGELSPRARAALHRARVVVTDPSVAPIVARETKVEVHAPRGIDELLLHARTGVVVRAFAASPLFSDDALAEIASAIDAPIEIEIIPLEHSLPLTGISVLVTRARPQSATMARALRRRGAVPILAPTISIGPPEDSGALRRAIESVAHYDVIAFTSANAVDAFFAALGELGRDARALHGPALAVIGPGTAAALAKYGVRADVTAKEHRGEALAEAVLARNPKRVLLPRAAVARDVFPEMLRARGVVVDVIEAYRTRPAEAHAPPPFDAVTFTSSSTVERFVELYPNMPLERVVVASIGPITSETCRKLGIHVNVEASPYTVPALVDALERAFTSL